MEWVPNLRSPSFVRRDSPASTAVSSTATNTSATVNRCPCPLSNNGAFPTPSCAPCPCKASRRPCACLHRTQLGQCARLASPHTLLFFHAVPPCVARCRRTAALTYRSPDLYPVALNQAAPFFRRSERVAEPIPWRPARPRPDPRSSAGPVGIGRWKARLQAFVLRETGPAGRYRSVPPGVACPRTASTGHDPSCWVAWLLCPNLYPFLLVLFPGCLSFPCPSFLLRRDPCRHRLPFHLSGNRPAGGPRGVVLVALVCVPTPLRFLAEVRTVIPSAGCPSAGTSGTRSPRPPIPPPSLPMVDGSTGGTGCAAGASFAVARALPVLGSWQADRLCGLFVRGCCTLPRVPQDLGPRLRVVPLHGRPWAWGPGTPAAASRAPLSFWELVLFLPSLSFFSSLCLWSFCSLGWVSSSLVPPGLSGLFRTSVPPGCQVRHCGFVSDVGSGRGGVGLRWGSFPPRLVVCPVLFLSFLEQHLHIGTGVSTRQSSQQMCPHSRGPFMDVRAPPTEGIRQIPSWASEPSTAGRVTKVRDETLSLKVRSLTPCFGHPQQTGTWRSLAVVGLVPPPSFRLGRPPLVPSLLLHCYCLLPFLSSLQKVRWPEQQLAPEAFPRYHRPPRSSVGEGRWPTWPANLSRKGRLFRQPSCRR